ncbi:Hypothetical predicted protein, partial [Olea europaea subsp. europaea]
RFQYLADDERETSPPRMEESATKIVGRKRESGLSLIGRLSTVSSLKEENLTLGTSPAEGNLGWQHLNQ